MNLSEFIKTHKTPAQILTPFEAEIYTLGTRQIATAVLHKRITELSKTDPDLEVWVPFQYWRYTRYNDKVRQPYYYREDVFISNKGRYFNLNKSEPKEEKGRPIKNGYRIFSLCIDKKYNCFQIQRAVACCFIPVPDELLGHKLLDLESNHIDGNKENNDMFNIEWVTGENNIQHAHDNKLRTYKTGVDHPLTKPLVGTVVGNSKFNGTTFVVNGRAECNKYKMGKAECVAMGKRKVRNGCTFKYLDKDDKNIPHISELPSELLTWFITPKITTYIGTNIDTGETIELTGEEEIKRFGFEHSKVSAVANGKRNSHKGYTFRKT